MGNRGKKEKGSYPNVGMSAFIVVRPYRIVAGTVHTSTCRIRGFRVLVQIAWPYVHKHHRSRVPSLRDHTSDTDQFEDESRLPLCF
jgi:hypothetical protein